MGQVNNVLIILGITALMAIITTVLAYFVDLIPSAVNGSGSRLATSILNGAIPPTGVD
ncbi:MAG: hypothetical protein MN733_24090 [Nitrososphaera sp.]|nr:hypothetical protein [Nitrososphaera sp.]